MALENKDWYDLQALADEWNVPVARVRMHVSSLEAAGVIQTRDKPGDRRYKQVARESVETLRKVAVGG
jgi:DNA-binding MarR family transcriptional regulator